jgi:hypothetical protein
VLALVTSLARVAHLPQMPRFGNPRVDKRISSPHERLVPPVQHHLKVVDHVKPLDGCIPLERVHNRSRQAEPRPELGNDFPNRVRVEREAKLRTQNLLEEV